MSGLFAANLLARVGWRADVYERAEMELTGRGAGIVTHPGMLAVLRAAGYGTHDLGIAVAGRKTLDRSGRPIGQYHCPQTLTSWDRVFRLLRELLPAGRYHLGKELRGIEQSADRPVAYFADGSRVVADLIVGADGFRSSVRAQILPAIRPVYAGYVAWRGLVPESALTPATHRDLFDALVFCLPVGEQCLAYPVAGPDNDLRPGHRRCNFVWYRPASEPELRRLLTDATGHLHALGIPPPLVAPRGHRRAARGGWPAAAAATRGSGAAYGAPVPAADLRRRDHPHDGRPHRPVGRCRVPGQAHVAAGVTKAAEDALALATALKSSGAVDVALARFESARIGINRQVMERGRDLGTYLQPQLANAEEHAKAERHRTAEAVMSEIAVLDFLRG